MGKSNVLGFGLDKITIERRGLVAHEPIVLHLPVPPSTNNLFISIAGRGRVIAPKYREWRQLAASTLWTQKRSYMAGPAKVTLTVPDKGRRDLDNFAKAICDLLVEHHFIADDSRIHLRELTIKWGDVEDCVVLIEPVEVRKAA